MKKKSAILSVLFLLTCVPVNDAFSFWNTAIDEQDLVKKYLQPNDVGRDRKYDSSNWRKFSLCTRNCTLYPTPQICYYIFNVEQYSTMGPACGNCSYAITASDCNHPQCIEADGIERMVVSINRMIPGPSIDVCSGDRIVVDVINRMPTAAVTIHWHGILQKTTPWMDGVPYVTQCPIQPNSKFRYDFPADTNGTFFYHAHIPYLHSNGLYGALIVRTPRATWDPNDVHHDYDVPSHVVQISDWNHYPAEAFFPGFFINSTHHPHRPDVFLINGRGWYKDSKIQTNVQPAEFHVTSGKTYRFRLIATTTSTCSFKFAVQDHTLKVVALDGYPCTPMNVSTVVMSSGQRTDIILIPNDHESSKNNVFQIVVKGMDSCNITNFQTALLKYDNSYKDPKPTNLKAVHEKTPVNKKDSFFVNHMTHSFATCLRDIPSMPRYVARYPDEVGLVCATGEDGGVDGCGEPAGAVSGCPRLFGERIRSRIQRNTGYSNNDLYRLLIFQNACDSASMNKVDRNHELLAKPPFLNNHELGGCNLNDNICSDTLPPAKGFGGLKVAPEWIADYTFVIKPGFHNYRIEELYGNNTYFPFYIPRGPAGAYAAVLNRISSQLPPVPLLTQERDLPPDIPICHGNCTRSDDSICHCINILEVKLNKVVDIQFEEGIIHPIHIHGHHFTIVPPQPALAYSPATILRDVVHAPLDKFARVRFIADNPGYWIMHCHFSAHFEGGMFLIFKVGDSRSFPAPPSGFPKCGNFLPAVQNLR